VNMIDLPFLAHSNSLKFIEVLIKFDGHILNCKLSSTVRSNAQDVLIANHQLFTLL
jgi:hypothetical protein